MTADLIVRAIVRTATQNGIQVLLLAQCNSMVVHIAIVTTTIEIAMEIKEKKKGSHSHERLCATKQRDP